MNNKTKTELLPKPDLSLIAECENLITKNPNGYNCGHELNRALHFYVNSFKPSSVHPFNIPSLQEATLRRILVKARLEFADYEKRKNSK